MEQKQLGIELLKKFAKTILGTVEEITDDLKDKKMSTGELIGLTDNVISLARQGLNWKSLIDEIKDFDTDEGKEMAAFLVSEGVASDKVGVILIHVAALAEKSYIAYIEDVVPIIEAIKK